MTRRGLRPTEFELEILKVLWDGHATARLVLERLTERQVGYTTVLKMLQVMEKKGLVSVDRAGRSHVYGPTVERNQILGGLVTDLVDRAFDGAARDLLVHLVEDGGLDDGALADLESRISALRQQEGTRD